MLAICYGLLACTLHFGCLLLTRLWAPLGWTGSLLLGAVVVWHLREKLLVPLLRPAPFAAAAAALGILYFLVAVRQRRGATSLGGAAAASLGSAALLALALVSFFHGSNTFRWHLLRHNTLIGTPAYYLLAEPVQSVCAEMWERHEGTRKEATPIPAPPVPEGAVRPNIVFVMIDTLRADGLEAYGGDPGLMPELNRFAEGALVFRDVLANATWTRPSVASFFTGLLPEEHGAVDRPYRLPPRELTLAEALRASGYRTAAFVSNYAAVGRDAGFDQGFDHFDQLAGDPHPYARADRVNGAVARWLADEAGGKGGGDRPLFLYLHYLDPHDPYLTPAEDGSPPEFGRPAYDAELRYVDRVATPLLDELIRDLEGPTWVFVTSDHGEEFFEHGEFGHGHSLYREVIHLPALLRTPTGDSGRLDARLEARDFFDLLLAVSRGGGLDVRRWAEERSRPRRYASIYSTSGAGIHRPYRGSVCMRGIEDEELYFVWSGYGSTYELYDRERDRGELANLARARPERIPDRLEALQEALQGWTTRDPVEHSDETLEQLRALGYVD